MVKFQIGIFLKITTRLYPAIAENTNDVSDGGVRGTGKMIRLKFVVHYPYSRSFSGGADAVPYGNIRRRQPFKIYLATVWNLIFTQIIKDHAELTVCPFL
eukprot:TRINITY_DN22034_c0_g1_i1.p2 TRINITY_DN22034_c0_g1~~TRINITY_DN22034_c0_g1_i1.p2  ORF type:complete len:100 (+),score=2.40 TRINITY_DN22034_c0_g1_i1:260-559(+)